MLTVEVTTKTGEGVRTLDLKYEIGGQEFVYTGLDGDEFHTEVRWDRESLIFDTIEPERTSDTGNISSCKPAEIRRTQFEKAPFEMILYYAQRLADKNATAVLAQGIP